MPWRAATFPAMSFRRSTKTLAALCALLCAAGCKTAAPIHPRAAEHNAACAEYLAQGDLDRAETRCNLALEFNPDYPEPFNNKGVIAIRRNDLPAAKELFVKAIRLNQDFAEAHNGLGFVFLHEGSFGKAHDEFQRALKVNPDYVEARYNLALTYLRMKKYADARKSYAALIETNAQLPDPHHDLCVLDIEDGDPNAAVAECREAIRLDARYVSAYFNLGNAYMKGGKYCEAQEAYTDCLRQDEANLECRNNVTIATRKCALLDPNLKEARKPEQETTGSDDPTADDPATQLYKKALAQEQAGLLNEARRNFNKCLRKNPNFALCHYKLFKLDQATADEGGAAEHCRALLKVSAEEQATEREECRTFLGKDGQ